MGLSGLMMVLGFFFSSSPCGVLLGLFFGMSCFVLLLLLLCFRQSIPDFVFGPFFSLPVFLFFFFICHRATDLFVLLPFLVLLLVGLRGWDDDEMAVVDERDEMKVYPPPRNRTSVRAGSLPAGMVYVSRCVGVGRRHGWLACHLTSPFRACLVASDGR